MGASLLFAPAVLLSAWALPTSDASLGLILAATTSFVGVSVFSIFDAVQLARGAVLSAASPSLGIGMGLSWVLLGVGYPVLATEALRAHVFEAYMIPTASMAPALLPGDRFLVDRSDVSTHAVSRGDLIVFRHPDGSGQKLVKRVLGLPGEDILVEEGRVLINGVPLARHALGPADTRQFGPTVAGAQIDWEVSSEGAWRVLSGPATRCPPPTRLRLSTDSFFVLGDHRDNAVDSRHFGPVDASLVEGWARYLWWPGFGSGRFGVLDGARPLSDVELQGIQNSLRDQR